MAYHCRHYQNHEKRLDEGGGSSGSWPTNSNVDGRF